MSDREGLDYPIQTLARAYFQGRTEGMSDENPTIENREILSIAAQDGDRIEIECRGTLTILRIWERGDREEDANVVKLDRDQGDALANYLVRQGCGDAIPHDA